MDAICDALWIAATSRDVTQVVIRLGAYVGGLTVLGFVLPWFVLTRVERDEAWVFHPTTLRLTYMWLALLLAVSLVPRLDRSFEGLFEGIPIRLVFPAVFFHATAVWLDVQWPLLVGGAVVITALCVRFRSHRRLAEVPLWIAQLAIALHAGTAIAYAFELHARLGPYAQIHGGPPR